MRRCQRAEPRLAHARQRPAGGDRSHMLGAVGQRCPKDPERQLLLELGSTRWACALHARPLLSTVQQPCKCSSSIVTACVCWAAALASKRPTGGAVDTDSAVDVPQHAPSAVPLVAAVGCLRHHRNTLRSSSRPYTAHRASSVARHPSPVALDSADAAKVCAL